MVTRFCILLEQRDFSFLGVYKLDSVQEKYRLGTEFAMDIVLFEQSSVVYAAALESDEDEVYASKLRLYRKFVSIPKDVMCM